MAIYTPYTYLIGWSAQNKWYYGVRYAKKSFCLYETGCHPDEFWVTYFTSSNTVKSFREDFGEPDIVQIRKIFSSRHEAIKWEDKVITRMNLHKRKDFLNKHAGKAIILDQEDFKRIKENRKEKWETLSEQEKKDIILERSKRTKDFWNSLSETERELIITQSNNKREINREQNWDDSFRSELKSKKQESWKISPKRDIHSKRTSERRRKEEQNKTEEEREEFSKICSDAYWSRPEERIKEHHNKQSIGTKKAYENNPDLRRMRSESTKGRIFINKGGKNKRVRPEEIDEYYKDGWVKGCIQNKKNKVPS